VSDRNEFHTLRGRAEACVLAVALLALAGFLFSCGEDSKPTEPDEESTLLASESVDAAGGRIEVPDMGIALDVPPGALSAPLTLTLAERRSGPEGSVGPVLELGPDGTTFLVPVTLSLAIPRTELPAGVWDEDLVVVTETGTRWTRVPTFVAATDEALEAHALLTHFSSYALVVVDQTSALYGTFGLGPNAVYGYGAGSVLARFDGSGVSASDLGLGSGTRLLDGWATGAADHYIAGGSATTGSIWHDSGSGFAPVAIPPGSGAAANQPLLAIDGAGGDILAVGYGGRAVAFESGSWMDASYLVPGGTGGTVRRLRGVVCFGGGGAVSVGDEIVLTRAGGVWSEVDLAAVFGGRRFFLNGVWASSPSHIVAVGREFDPSTAAESGIVLTYDGLTWVRSIVGSASSYEGVWGNGSTIVIVGSNGAVLSSPDGSPGWAAESLCDTTSSTLYDVWVGASDFVAAVGSGAVFLYTGPDCSGGAGGDIVLPFDTLPVTECGQSWSEQGVTMIFEGGDCFITHVVEKPDGDDATYVYTFTSVFRATLPGSYQRAEIDVSPIHPSIPVRAFAARGGSTVDSAETAVGAQGAVTLVLEGGGGFTELRVEFAHGTLNEIRLTE